MTLQLVRPDIRQSCILLAAVSSRASHQPTTSSTTAIANPAIAGLRLFLGSGSFISESSFRSFAMYSARIPLQSAASPRYRRPYALVHVVPRDLGYNLKSRD